MKEGRTKGSTPVLAVGQPVIMRSDTFCRAGSSAVCSRKFSRVTLEMPELSNAIVSNSTLNMCSPKRFAVESSGRGALDRVSAMICCVPFL